MKWRYCSAVARKIKTHDQAGALTVHFPERNLDAKGKLFDELKQIMAKRDQLQAIENVLKDRFGEAIAANADSKKRLEAQKVVVLKLLDKAIADGAATDDLEGKLLQLEVDIFNAGLYERNRTIVVTDLENVIKAANDLIAAFTEKTAEKPSPIEVVSRH